MPLDPIIANPTPLKLNLGDPIEDFNNYLLAGTRMSAMADARRTQANKVVLNNLIKKHTDKNGELNFNALRYDAAQIGIGDVNQGLTEDMLKNTKSQGEIRYKDAETNWKQEQAKSEIAEQGVKNATKNKTVQETFEKAWNNHKQKLNGISTDPAVATEQLIQWTKENFADPDIGPVLRGRGQTPESAVAELQANLSKLSPEQFGQYLLRLSDGNAVASEKHTTVVDNGGTNTMVETNTHNLGGASKPDTLQTWKVTESPKAPKTTNNTYVNVAVKTDEAYGKRQAEHRADDDHELEKAANAAPDLIREADRIDHLLKSGQVFTGAAAPLQLGVEKVKDVFGAGDKEKIKNTEILNSSLSKRTLAAAQTSGLGTGNGFTDRDREFLQDAQAGRITWDPGSIAYNNDIARRVARATIEKWKARHDRVEETGVGGRTYPKDAPTAPPPPRKKPLSPAAQKLLKKHGH